MPEVLHFSKGSNDRSAAMTTAGSTGRALVVTLLVSRQSHAVKFEAGRNVVDERAT